MAILSLNLIISLAFILFTSVTAKPNPNIIDKTCRNTSHYQDCLSALSSYPNSKTADIPGLIGITIKLAKSSGNDTLNNYIQPMWAKTDPNTELFGRCLDSCREAYNDAISMLDISEAALNSNDKHDVLVYLSLAPHEVKQYCQEKCQGVDSNKNIFTARNKKFQILCSIALSISKLWT